MPRAQQKGGVRGHGQRGERGSYRSAWAEGDYTRQGLNGTSDEEEAASADVSAASVHIATLLSMTGMTEADCLSCGASAGQELLAFAQTLHSRPEKAEQQLRCKQQAVILGRQGCTCVVCSLLW